MADDEVDDIAEDEEDEDEETEADEIEIEHLEKGDINLKDLDKDRILNVEISNEMKKLKMDSSRFIVVFYLQ